MTWRSWTCVLMLVLLLGHGHPAAAANPLELRWNELAPLITAHVVKLALPGGATVRGEVAAIREDALVLDVKSTSDAKAYPKGNATIPRTSISVLRLERERGKWGRGVGTTVGALVGVTLGAFTAVTLADSTGSGSAIFAAVAGVTTVAGYFVGRGLDSRTTEIRVVP